MPAQTNPRRRILFLIHTLGGGGAEKVLVDTVNKLDKTKFDITVMTVINTGVNIARLDDDITYKSMITPPKFLTNKSSSGSLSASGSKKVKVLGSIYNYLWRIIPCSLVYRIFIREKYDTEVAFLEGVSAKIIAGSPNRKSKKIGWIHVDFANEHKSSNVFRSSRAEKECYSSFDELVCVSDDTLRGFEAVVGIKNRARVLRNVIDIDAVIAQSNESPPDKNNRQSVVKICSIGRLAPQKGYDRLLRIAKKLNDDSLDFSIDIIGDGPDKGELLQYMKRHNINNVNLLGFYKNPYKHVAASDIFVISSRAEGFSTVMTEAIAIGTPTITTNVSGTSNLPSNMVTQNTEDDLYKALHELISQPKKLAELRRSTATAQKRIFADIDSAVSDVEEIIAS